MLAMAKRCFAGTSGSSAQAEAGQDETPSSRNSVTGLTRRFLVSICLGLWPNIRPRVRVSDTTTLNH